MPDRLAHSTCLAVLFLLAALPGLMGCGDPGIGPVDVKWDRITCDRCRMVLSARDYSAQIRAFKDEGKSSLHFFDDIGCAVIWLDEQSWREDPRTQIWVTDWRNGTWIDARTAYYLKGKETPMQYGLGAQPEPDAEAIDFAAARRHIHEVEERINAPIFNPAANQPVGAGSQADPPVSGDSPPGDTAKGSASGLTTGAGPALPPSAAAAAEFDHDQQHLHVTE